VQVQLLVWIFTMRVAMLVASVASYLVNEVVQKNAFKGPKRPDFEAPLTALVWLTSLVCIALTFAVSYVMIKDLDDGTMWWKLSLIISCGTLAGAVLPGGQVFTSTLRPRVGVVTASREGALNVLADSLRVTTAAGWLIIPP
jgi:K(+)-stimulated pyrophosphate-energized sodium pump